MQEDKIKKWISKPNLKDKSFQGVTEGMPRFAKKEYPLGSYPQQKEAGLPMNPEMYKTLKIFSNKITDDMTFTLLVTGSEGAVRMGKSLFAQQVAKCYTELLNKNLRKLGRHNEQIDFSMKNIVFDFEKGKKRAFELKPFSTLIFDESNDLRGHALSKKMQEVGAFFDKNGQLNLFVIIIAPNFFRLPPDLSVDRSNLLAVVKFINDKEKKQFFKRGYYDIFSPKDKRILYFKGKKQFQDINAHKPSFRNCFFYGKTGYIVDKKDYTDQKRKDTEDMAKSKENAPTKYQARQKVLYPIIEKMLKDGATIKDVCDSTLIDKKTFYNWGFSREKKGKVDEGIYMNIQSEDDFGGRSEPEPIDIRQEDQEL